MDNKVSPSKYGIEYGMIFGAIMILEFVILYVFNINLVATPILEKTFSLLNYVILPITIIIIACNYYKKNKNSGFISIPECLKIGVTICFLAGLFFVLFSTVFNLIFPEFLVEVLRNTRSALLKNSANMTTDQVEAAMSLTKKFMNPIIVIPVKTVIFTLVGLVYSSIIGGILKKENHNIVTTNA